MALPSIKVRRVPFSSITSDACFSNWLGVGYVLRFTSAGRLARMVPFRSKQAKPTSYYDHHHRKPIARKGYGTIRFRGTSVGSPRCLNVFQPQPASGEFYLDMAVVGARRL